MDRFFKVMFAIAIITLLGMAVLVKELAVLCTAIFGTLLILFVWRARESDSKLP